MVKTNEHTCTWLMALTDSRIIMINRHLIVGTEYTEIPLSMINSISCQERLFLSSISIVHGSGGIIIDNIVKGCEKPFVNRANVAIEKIRKQGTNDIVNAIKNINGSNILIADEILKLKGLLDQGVITQDEFDSQKTKLFG